MNAKCLAVLTASFRISVDDAPQHVDSSVAQYVSVRLTRKVFQ